jgi:hypothetical protein
LNHAEDGALHFHQRASSGRNPATKFSNRGILATSFAEDTPAGYVRSPIKRGAELMNREDLRARMRPECIFGGASDRGQRTALFSPRGSIEAFVGEADHE